MANKRPALSTISRRAFLVNAATIPILTQWALGRTAFHEPNTRFGELGVQLFSVGPNVRTDLIETLKGIRAMGYTCIEMAGFMGHGEEQWRDALKLANLECRSVHFAIQPIGAEPGLESGFDRIVEFCHRIDIEYVVVASPWIPDRFASVLTTAGRTRASVGAAFAQLTDNEWDRTAVLLNEYGRQLAKHHIKLGYHNHNSEFARHGERTRWDRLVAMTEPNFVSFELDIGWTASSGIDPSVLLNRYPGRITQLHVRDLAASNTPNVSLNIEDAALGTGVIDLRAVLTTAKRVGVRYFYVEEDYSATVMTNLQKSFLYLEDLTI